jgi:hypothetical protein
VLFTAHIVGAYVAPAHGASHTAPGSSWIAGAVVLAVFAAAVALLAYACLRALGDDEGGEDDPGWGGGGGNVPTRPRGPVGQDDGPAWWPEFERQFAAWVERTQRGEPVVVTARLG